MSCISSFKNTRPKQIFFATSQIGVPPRLPWVGVVGTLEKFLLIHAVVTLFLHGYPRSAVGVLKNLIIKNVCRLIDVKRVIFSSACLHTHSSHLRRLVEKQSIKKKNLPFKVEDSKKKKSLNEINKRSN